MNDLEPMVGNWYRDLDSQTDFEVVAVDEDAQTIEIQYFEGEVEEIDLDSWYAMVLEPIAQPEDWSGPFDDVEPDDLGYDDSSGSDKREDPLHDLD